MIGSLIRSARRRKGLSSKELAKFAGMAPSNLSRLESDRSDVRISTVLRVLDAMGLTLDVVPAPTADIDDVRRRMEEGAARLARVGVSSRGVDARLAWKEAKGIDTSVERRMLEQ